MPDIHFIVEVSPAEVAREKQKARDLRKTRWWRNKLDKGRCYYCGRAAAPSELTMDHVVPLIRGGRSTRNNVVVACKECNDKKKYLLPVEWEDYLNNMKKRDD